MQKMNSIHLDSLRIGFGGKRCKFNEVFGTVLKFMLKFFVVDFFVRRRVFWS